MNVAAGVLLSGQDEHQQVPDRQGDDGGRDHFLTFRFGDELVVQGTI